MRLPALRFKEFSTTWQFKKFLDVTDVLRCGIASTPIYVEEGVPFLSAQNVSSNGHVVLDKYNFISEDFYKKISKNNELIKGDLLYSRVGASYGNAAVFELVGSYGVYVSLTHIRPNRSLNNYFLMHYLNSDKGKEQAKNGVVQGGGVPNLNVKVVEKFSIPVPSLEEQTKIANFLTAVDEKITQLTQKHDLLTQYKKGVMQQIFSQELRFKDDDGRDFPEWEESKLGDISSFFSGGTPLTTNKSFYNGNIAFIKSGEIGAAKTEQFITDAGLKGSSAKMVSIGDLLYALYGATSGEVAISKVEGAINQAVLCIRSKLNTYYLYSYLRFKKSTILGTYLQGGQGNLSAEIIKSLEVPCPCAKEQTKIANFLTAIDDKITATQTQLQAVKQYKQGLLQQMFV